MYPPKPAAQHVYMDPPPPPPPQPYPPQPYPPQVTTGYPMPPATHHQGHQPLNYQPPHGVPSQWSSGICECAQDPCSCCLTCWCPCIAFGQIAEIVDEGNPSCALSGLVYGALLYFTGCACCYSCLYRTKMRSKFNLAESPCGDCLLHFCCDQCALCQEYRELKHKGLDPALGWGGNSHKHQQQQGIGMNAPAAQTMY